MACIRIGKDGEHWFHKNEQMQFLDNWILELAKKNNANYVLIDDKYEIDIDL